MKNSNIKEIAILFFKLGLTAFGGPVAHIAMMEEEVVNRRKWMTREHFLDLVGATNLIPGPNSTEMAIHCGYHRAGWRGMLAAGICFIFPAVLLTGFLAFLYVEYGTIPQVEPFFYGIRAAILAIIVSAIIKLGKKALKNWQLGCIGLCVMISSLLGVSEVISILSGGILGMLWLCAGNKFKGLHSLFLFTGKVNTEMAPVVTVISQPVMQTTSSLLSVFGVFLKIGCILFGSGYVLIAYLQGEVVEKFGWISQQELLDAVAIGQFTPGPVLSTATFIGYQIYGFWGAVLATCGIFMPSFIFVLILNPIIPKLRKSQWASKFLDAVNISAVGIMLSVTLMLAKTTLQDWRTFLIALSSILITIKYKKLSSLWIVSGGSLLGYFLSFI